MLKILEWVRENKNIFYLLHFLSRFYFHRDIGPIFRLPELEFLEL